MSRGQLPAPHPSGASLPSLPTELVAHISSYFGPVRTVRNGPYESSYWEWNPDDPQADLYWPPGNLRNLLAFATTCRRLYSISVPFLYRRVEVSGCQGLDRLLRTLRDRPELSRHVKELVVRDVRVHGTSGHPFADALKPGAISLPSLRTLDIANADPLANPVVLPLFLGILPASPALERLIFDRFRGAAWQGISFPCLPQVRELHLKSCAMVPCHVRNTIGMLPNLEYLTSYQLFDFLCGWPSGATDFGPAGPSLKAIALVRGLGHLPLGQFPNLQHLKGNHHVYHNAMWNVMHEDRERRLQDNIRNLEEMPGSVLTLEISHLQNEMWRTDALSFEAQSEGRLEFLYIMLRIIVQGRQKDRFPRLQTVGISGLADYWFPRADDRKSLNAMLQGYEKELANSGVELRWKKLSTA